MPTSSGSDGHYDRIYTAIQELSERLPDGRSASGIKPEDLQEIKDQMRSLHERMDKHFAPKDPEPEPDPPASNPLVDRYLADATRRPSVKADVARISNNRLIKQLKRKR